MGLFDKKYCDVCGEKIGFLGNRKLEDGNLCKNCANKLSYWFDERRQSTVEQIKEQLAYREANKAQVEAFNITRTLGRDTKIAVDDEAGKFMVVRTDDYIEENPDVLDFSQVISCDFDIQESRQEEKWQNKEGEYVSYNPPRYHWDYDFDIILNVKHTYFDDINFNLGSARVESSDFNRGSNLARMLSGSFNPHTHPDYVEYEKMGNEIRALFMEKQQEKRDSIAAANAPKKSVICPGCGATTIPDANGRCEYCLSAINR